jgi:hypothetical protein
MEGNCVDKWIKKRFNKSLLNLMYIRRIIRNRTEERSNTSDYFNTLCYEQDFNDIIKIRDEAQLIVENCNKFLERISEQYSKLN